MTDLFASHDPDGDVGTPQVPGPGHSPPRVRAPRTGDALGLDDWDTPTSRPGSRRWLLAAAALPWVVVVAIMATGDRSPAPTAPAPTGAATATAAEAASTAPTARATTPPTDPRPTVDPSGEVAAAEGGVPLVLEATSGPTTLGAARGVALAVARSWLSTRPAGPAIEGLSPAPGAGDRYVEHLVVESIDHPARGALVVTLRALVLPVEDDHYGTAEQLRVAVPVAVDADGAHPAGTPWRLPVDAPRVVEPTTSPVEDPDLQVAAVDAVTAAGYRDVDLTALSRTSGWAWVVEVTARAPGRDDREDHRIWLRADVGRLVVAGAPAPAAAAPPRADTPSDGPTDEEPTP